MLFYWRNAAFFAEKRPENRRKSNISFIALRFSVRLHSSPANARVNETGGWRQGGEYVFNAPELQSWARWKHWRTPTSLIVRNLPYNNHAVRHTRQQHWLFGLALRETVLVPTQLAGVLPSTSAAASMRCSASKLPMFFNKKMLCHNECRILRWTDFMFSLSLVKAPCRTFFTKYRENTRVPCAKQPECKICGQRF